MTFTYAADTAITTDLQKVRFLLQDTTNSTKRPSLISDEEINWAVSTEMNVYLAAALCADTLAARFRGTSSKKVGSLELRHDPKMWDAVAAKLRARGMSHMDPTAGGILEADRDDFWENADLLRPSFYSQLHQNPEGVSPASPRDTNEEAE